MEDRRRGIRQSPPERDRGLAAPDPRVGRVLDDRYRLVERLAAGGMGVVYRAERIGLARQVAVKFLHRSAASVPGHRARFEREAAAMSRVTHPNLVSISDFGSADGVPFLVMDFYPGTTLRKALKEGAMEPRRAVFIARQILAGVGSAHASGVVHRDLKPGNVLLVGSPGEDLVKILDFGVAKLLEGGGGPSDLSTVAGYVLGTPEYMAPEQARSEKIDHRVDIYAVGILLYEMLAGRRPFHAEGDLAILHKHIEEAPRRLRDLVPEVSDELEAVTLRALEKDRASRWQTASEFSRALAAVPEGGTAPLDGEAAPSPPRVTDDMGPPPPPRRSRARAGDEEATVAKRAPRAAGSGRPSNSSSPPPVPAAARRPEGRKAAAPEPRRARAGKPAGDDAAVAADPPPRGRARADNAAVAADPPPRGRARADDAGAGKPAGRGRARAAAPGRADRAARAEGESPRKTRPPPPPPGRRGRAPERAPEPDGSGAATRIAPLGELEAMAHPDASSVPTRLAPFVELEALVDADASAAETRIAPLAPDASAAETRMTPSVRGAGTGAHGSMTDGASARADRSARRQPRRGRAASGVGLAVVVIALALIAAGVLYALVQDGGIVWPW